MNPIRYVQYKYAHKVLCNITRACKPDKVTNIEHFVYKTLRHQLLTTDALVNISTLINILTRREHYSIHGIGGPLPLGPVIGSACVLELLEHNLYTFAVTKRTDSHYNIMYFPNIIGPMQSAHKVVLVSDCLDEDLLSSYFRCINANIFVTRIITVTNLLEIDYVKKELAFDNIDILIPLAEILD
ncbi:MAG: hypothetical protein GXO10_06580 [Crenarchaeota archaeon]|nr:hypothetical protein [Thermoproteota archaeon]